MKTFANQIRKSLSKISTIAILSTSALLTSCQKDDVMAPGPHDGMESYNRSEVSRTKNTSQAATFTFLTIDHSCAQTNQQSYKIEIKTDGSVLYTGRKNVAAIGEFKFSITKDIMIAIRSMYMNSQFNELENMPFTFDLASTTTTFTAKFDAEHISKIDYNQKAPSKVIDLRKAENMLNISKFTQKDNQNNLEENMAQQFN